MYLDFVLAGKSNDELDLLDGARLTVMPLRERSELAEDLRKSEGVADREGLW